MADDRLVFPIGFDLDSAVQKAASDWDGKYADQLEKAIQKRALEVKLTLSTKNFDSLEDVKKRLAELKLEPITPETKTAIKELAAELRTLAKALEQVQKYSVGKSTVSPDAVRAARINEINQRSAEKAAIALDNQRAAAARAAAAEERLAIARDKSAQAAARAAKGVTSLTDAYREQSLYLDRLLKRMVTYWSVQQVQHFLQSVREVTAQFELQRVSLGAIIQDQTEANRLFSQIKSFALKSPVSIMDLTKYTKQVAAYGIETEKLFDTTKMLTDVSVGLGTDVGRLTLAYGQIKAASVLKMSETRQLTEAGIPALELLSKQLEQTYGRAVSTAEVMELISKRAISFEMVEQMFKDMTSSGGMFYNMQEKQGNTLFGLWAKLGDAASVMYDEIGNTSSVNEGMKNLIQLLTSLMKNWRLVGMEMLVVATTIGIITTKQKAHATATNLQQAAMAKVRSAGIAYNAILAEEKRLLAKGTAAQLQSVAARKANAKAALDAAIAERTAATSTNVWTRSMQKLKEAFIGNWLTLLIAGIAALGVGIYNAVQKANRLKNTLNDIDAERLTLTTQSVRNFELLATAAVNAADGSKEQKDALDELHRTYKDMIPVQDLTIEKLRAMHGNYQSLTTAIREYIAEQQKQKKLSAIEEIYGEQIQSQYKQLRKYLTSGKEINVGSRKLRVLIKFELSDTEYERFFNEFEKQATDSSKSISEKIRDAFANIGMNLTPDQIKAIQKIGKWGVFDDASIVKLNEALSGQAAAIEGVHRAAADSVGDLGRYKDTLDKISERVQKYRLVSSKGEGVERNTYLFQQGQQNFQIKEWAQSMKTELEQAGVTVQEGIFNLVQQINENDPTKISTIDFSKLLPLLDTPEVKERLGNSYETFKNYVLSIQESYEGIVPSDPIVQAVRNNMFVLGNATQEGMDKMKKYLWDGKGDIKDHLKTLKESAKGLEDEIYKYSNYIKLFGVAGKMVLKMMGVDVDALTEEYDALTEQIQYVQTYVKETDKSGGSQSDTRLQTLNEMVQLAEKLNKEYQDWQKKVGSTEALERVRNTYEDTVKYAEELAKENGITLPHLEVPTNAKELNEYLKVIQGLMDNKTIKGGKKAAIELGVKISGNISTEEQQAIEKKIKELADRISRTKTAREFYEKVLGMTGDVELAATLSFAVHGEDGRALKKQIREQIEQLVEGTSATLDLSVFRDDGTFDPKKLREFAKAQADALGGTESKAYQGLIKLSDDAEKDFEKTIENWLKATEKAKTYSDKMLDLARTTSNEIARINTRKGYAQTRITELLGMENLTDGEQKELADLQNFLSAADTLIQRFKDKQAQEETKLGYEAFKDSPMYVQMFDDLDHASTKVLENMKSRITSMQTAWKDLDPTQLKELQSRLNEIDNQLAKRNPFKGLIDGIKEYRRMMKEGDSRGNKSAGAAAADLMAASKRTETAAKAFQDLLDKYGDGTKEGTRKLIESNKEVADAKRELDDAMSNEKAAQKAVENWKKVKDTIGLSANELFSMLNWAGDIAKGIADISEAMGADEEDVQYWNDIASALGDISGGIQDIVQAAMSGNVVGIVSSTLTAIPKMIVGFTNLFSAGKVKRANKEIKKQQQLLDQLEYTYGRLENAADKLFGADYINNYNQQMRNLQAQAAAYQKQAAAERSKGKKADKDKIKEYEEAYRETMDEIADMEAELTAKFVGSSRTDLARDFAQSWLEAKASFASTTDAIKSKYKDMIQSMIIEGAAAKIIDNILSPMWDKMGTMLEKNDITGAIDYLVNDMDSFIQQADDGMNVLWESLRAKGYDMQKLLGDTDTSEYTGIKRDIASASEETMNNVATIGNTLMFYVSPIPNIAENVAVMRALMEGGTLTEIPSTPAGWTDWQQQAMDNYNAIARNTAETVAECRRAADACNAAAENLRRVIAPRGTTTTYGVHVYM